MNNVLSSLVKNNSSNTLAMTMQYFVLILDLYNFFEDKDIICSLASPTAMYLKGKRMNEWL